MQTTSKKQNHIAETSPEQLVILNGTIEKILFKNQESGFTVFVLRLNRTQDVTVQCITALVNAGETVEVAGVWASHPKYGKQLHAQRCTINQPTSIIGLKKYLGSGLIKGIGPKYAERLVEHFGHNVLTIIDKNPERLQEVGGIGTKRLETIIEAWKDQKEISHIMLFLQEKGISTAYATKIYKTYRNKSIEVMLENPYRLCEDVWGIGFKTADTIAQQLAISHDSQKRCRAGILHCISMITQQGHLAIELAELRHTVHQLLELDTEKAHVVKNALYELHHQDKIKVITYQDAHFITLSQYYLCEKGVATRIQEIQQASSSFSVDTNALYQQLRTATQSVIELNEDQQRGIVSCFSHKITVITGGPGTGKTTLVRSLLDLLTTHSISYKLAAPTGRAAKRITQTTGRQAVTLHRLLEFEPALMNFTRTEQNALTVQMLIIDEASMIDIFLAHALLKATPNNAHVVFIGDIDQLPSVGAGNFLRNVIESQTVATIRLTQLFRQAQESAIVTNAHRINNGEFPVVDSTAAQDFFFIKEDDPLNLPMHLQKIYTKFLPRFGIYQTKSIVLSPMNRGTGGTHILNHELQKIINHAAEGPSVTYSGYTYRTNDRVMQVRNNYDKFVFNGDIGTIELIDQHERMLVVNFGDQSVEYEFNDLDELVLAYAISIHKSQGSEYDAVIIPIFMQHFTLLQKNLVYTAVTRAKKLCVVIGQSKALWVAIKNTNGTQRTTFLQHLLAKSEMVVK